MKKKQRLTLQDLGRVPLTPAKTTEGYDPDLWNTLKREEAEAPILKAKQEFDKNFREVFKRSERVKAFMSLPIDELRAYGRSAMPEDLMVEYEENTGPRDYTAEYRTSRELENTLEEKGVELSDAGWQRFAVYLSALGRQRHLAPTLDNMLRVLERLHYGLGAFAPGEIVKGTIPQVTQDYVQQPIADQVGPQETEVQRRKRIADQIETASDAEALAIINNQWGRAVQAMYRQFAAFMQETYHVDVLQPRIVEFAGEWAMRWNKNLGDPRHLNELRRALDYQFYGNRGQLLTSDERLAKSLEDAPLNPTFEQRRDIAERLQANVDAMRR